MHRSSDLTDEPSRFKQFAWEQWENQPFAVIFRFVKISFPCTLYCLSVIADKML